MGKFKKTFDYSERYQQAILGMIKDLFEEVSEEGLPGESSFYVTFNTEAEGVELSPTLKEHYADQMTIVLQNQFWGLSVDEEAFSVTLRFGGAPETLRVPWLSLLSFADPSAEFGLQLRAGEESQQPTDGGRSRGPLEGGPKETVDDEGESSPPKTAEVLSFEKFKKK